jgi:hypothetical protein
MVLKLFNLDLHISVIEDVKDICNKLYGEAVHITSWCISGHTFVFGRKPAVVDIVNQESWRFIDDDKIQEFQARYDSELQTYDGFIVTHTPVFALLYEKYNKPIIVVNSCRYDQPYANLQYRNGMDWISHRLEQLWRRGNLIMISNNRADQTYLKLGANIDSMHMPSLCLYTRATYMPRRPEFIVYGERSIFPAHPLLVERPQSGYTWDYLYSFKGIVHTPYEISTMSLFEQYSAGVPLFLPTAAFYKKCIISGKMKLISNYAGTMAAREEFTTIEFWLSRADYYDADNFKHIYYYDSFEDLIDKISTFSETIDIWWARQSWLRDRQQRILEAWRSIFSHYFKL